MAVKELFLVFLLIFIVHRILNETIERRVLEKIPDKKHEDIHPRTNRPSPLGIVEEEEEDDDMENELRNFIENQYRSQNDESASVTSVSPNSNYAEAAFGNTNTDLSKYFAEKQNSTLNNLPSTLKHPIVDGSKLENKDMFGNVAGYSNDINYSSVNF